MTHTDIKASPVLAFLYLTDRAMSLISLLTAFGMGSIITALVQSWLSRRSQTDERRFREKQQAYIGLLEAYHRAATERTAEAAKNFAYWQMRSSLVAPLAVRLAVQKVIDTNEDKQGRALAQQEMEEEMRKDLGVTK
jgi:hypothetical protein